MRMGKEMKITNYGIETISYQSEREPQWEFRNKITQNKLHKIQTKREKGKCDEN